MAVLPLQLRCHIDSITNMDERTRYLLQQAADTITEKDTRITALLADGAEYNNLETINTFHLQRAQAAEEQLQRCRDNYFDLARIQENVAKEIVALRRELAEYQSALDQHKNALGTSHAALVVARVEKAEANEALAHLQYAKRSNEELENQNKELAAQVNRLLETTAFANSETIKALTARDASASALEANLGRIHAVADYLGLERSKKSDAFITAIQLREAKAERNGTASKQAWQDLREHFGFADSLEPSQVVSRAKNAHEGLLAEAYAGTKAQREKQMSDGDYSDLIVGLLAAKIDPARLAHAAEKAAARRSES